MDNQRNPSLYQINTRVWLRQFDQPGRPGRLSTVPDAYWDYLQGQGIQYVWLMGIWRTVSKSQVLKYASEPGLREDYTRALPDWTEADVIGSPYAIDVYEPAVAIGTWQQFAQVRKKLHKRDMRLILDFVPNHFHAESSLIEQHPYVFLPAEAAQIQADPATFYRYQGKIWAHGQDPYFPAWKDTVQVNYFDNRARDFMSDQLLRLAEICDGVRCDMAMLMLNTVFESTWRQVGSFVDRNTEFWDRAIHRIKEQFPDFQFIAEAYWDLEWQLQQLGFDFTYDKRLLDRLHEGNVPSVRGHLFADPDFRNRSVRFLENHDEDRILSRVNTSQAEAAAVITYTLPGMRFYYDGQWEGRRVRLPVQLGRAPQELHCTCAQADFLYQQQHMGWVLPVCKCTYAFYQKLLRYLQKPIFREGKWQQLEVAAGQEHFLAWEWRWQQEQVVIVVNYSNQTVWGKIPRLAALEAGTRISEPWRARTYVISEQETRPMRMYPFEYRIIEWKGQPASN